MMWGGLAVVVVLVIILLVVYRKDLYTPSPPTGPAAEAMKMAVSSFSLLAPGPELDSAKKVESSMLEFSQKSKAGNVVGALQSLNAGLQALTTISPVTVAKSVSHAHPQACIPPGLGPEIQGTLTELKKTATLSGATISWVDQISKALPACAAEPGAPQLAAHPMGPPKF